MFKIELSKRYIPALILIGILVIITNILSQKVIESNNEYAKLINISGKQRMLSQKLIILATNYHLKKDDNSKKQFINSLKQMQDAHTYLLSKIISSKMEDIYYKENLDFNLKNYFDHFQKLLEKNDVKYLDLSRHESASILKQLDQVVKEYERYANEQLKNLSSYEFYLMCLILLTLVLAALFIFRPASKQINKITDDLIAEKEYEDTVIESSNNALIAINWLGKITTYNKKAEEIFGWNKEEMLNSRNLSNIIPEKYKKAHLKALNNYLETGKSIGILGKTVELEAIRKDGTIFPVRISFGSKYKVKGAIVIANIADISNEKEQESLLLQQSKMASMGEMISNITHQWRQPLSAISSLSSGIVLQKEMGVLNDDNLKDAMYGINDAVQFLSDTIDDFRSFYKISNEKEIFIVSDAIKIAETITRDAYKSNKIEIIKSFDDSEIKCNGIQSQLSQVILNLFNNARDIILEKQIKDKKVLIELSSKDDLIILNFYDNAGGVPASILPKIFEPYTTTKSKKQGTGIGLYMSYEIINKQFSGQITVENKEFILNDEKHFGACFTLSIPKNA